MFSSLGILHSKVNLLFTRLRHSVILKGFRLNWSEQTGFKSEELISATQNCISKTSLILQHLVLVGCIKKFHAQLETIFSMCSTVPPFIWAIGVKNYRFLFSQYSIKHQRKLSNVSLGSQLEHLFPEISFSAKQNVDIDFLLSKVSEGYPSTSDAVPGQVVDSVLQRVSEGYPSTSDATSAQVVDNMPRNINRVEVDVTESYPSISVPVPVQVHDQGTVSEGYPSASDACLIQVVDNVPMNINRVDVNVHEGYPSTSGAVAPQVSVPSSSGTVDSQEQNEVSRPLECNVTVFTPEMITPVYYDPANFAPICIDGVAVPESLLELASFSPSFSPTPQQFQPPDGNVLHEELMEYHRVLCWKYKFRSIEFSNASSIEEFLQTTLASFKKSPWYKKSQNKPPPLPNSLQMAFDKVYSTIMDPKNWYKFQQNLTRDLRQAITTARSLPSQGIGVYLQD